MGKIRQEHNLGPELNRTMSALVSMNVELERDQDKDTIRTVWGSSNIQTNVQPRLWALVLLKNHRINKDSTYIWGGLKILVPK